MIYKEIKSLKGEYFARPDGSIWRVTEEGKKHQKPSYNLGYHTMRLRVGGKYNTYKVHRLIAEAFIPNPYNKPCVNHIDGNKTNNEASNLEWVTYKENSRHAVKNGLIKTGLESHVSTLSASQLELIQECISKGIKQVVIADGLGVSTSLISSIKTEKLHKSEKRLEVAHINQ